MELQALPCYCATLRQAARAATARESIPFVVVVQSSLFNDYRRSVVVPLVDKSSIGKVTNPRLNPTFRIKGQSVVLHPLEIVSVATENLGDFIKSLRQKLAPDPRRPRYLVIEVGLGYRLWTDEAPLPC